MSANEVCFSILICLQYRCLLFSYPPITTPHDSEFDSHGVALQKAVYLRRMAHYQLQRYIGHAYYQMVTACMIPDQENIASATTSTTVSGPMNQIGFLAALKAALVE